MSALFESALIEDPLYVLPNELKQGGKIIFARQCTDCLPQKLKSIFFEKISSGGFLKETWSEEKLKKNTNFTMIL